MRKNSGPAGHARQPSSPRLLDGALGAAGSGSAANPARVGRGGPGHWEHFPHEADIGIRGFGPTKAEAFAQAAVALTAAIVDPGSIRPLEAVDITCHAPDDELLLVDWLNVLTYEMAARGMLFGEFTVEIEPGRLHGRARGEQVDRQRHEPAVEVKGATFAELRVDCAADGEWLAQCVIDV